MFRNYFLISIRNMFKHRAFTAINIFGLALSMSVCMVIILLILHHYSFDNFHEKGDRTYRIISYEEGKMSEFQPGYATSPLPIGQWLRDNYADVEVVANLNIGFNGELISEYKVIDIRSVFADEHFFKVFSFELLEGNPTTALKEPYSLILSQEKAKLLFPKSSAMGQLVEFKDHGSYKVTGIIKKPSTPTHVSIEAFGSMSTIPLLVEKGVITKEYNWWNNQWMNYNYVTLREGAAPDQLIEMINKVGNENTQIKEGKSKYIFDYQKLTEIVPGKLLGNEMGFALPKLALIVFTVLALVVITTASINYANLSIAKSISRAKEIGIRKANGAQKSQIILQFLTESVIIASIAFLAAIPIYKYLIVRFNEIWIFNQVGIHLEDTGAAYIIFVGFTLFLGLITGLGPSLYLSKINIISSLKGVIDKPGGSNKWYKFSSKKAMLSLQFGLSIFLLVTIFLLKSQGDFLVKSDHGFDEENIYYIELQGKDHEIMKSEFSDVLGISNISLTSHNPAVGRSHGGRFSLDKSIEPVTIYNFSVDENYLDIMHLELLAGDNLTNNKNNQLLINEQAVEVLGLGNIRDAVGKFLYDEDSLSYVVSGVIKDYHWEPIMKGIRPLALKVDPEEYELMYFKIEDPNPKSVEARLTEKWTLLDEQREFKGGFLSEEMDMFYQFLYDLGGILTFVGLLALTITGLGFLGMLSFNLKTRTKEIGVRKVLGADFKNILWSLSKGFIIMLLITSLVAYPLAIIANNLWISEMASHAPIGFSNVGPAILLVALMAATTIISQVWKNTRNNPVDALRSE
ncbi:MAG: putative ABC transport system permease protein [Cyclobacteriaceae bacterium]|jgi:putative ABC transport system permease protein